MEAFRRLAIMACAAFVFASCGSGGSNGAVAGGTPVSEVATSSSPTSRTTSQATSDPEGAVTALGQWIADYAKGDGAGACALQTARYTMMDLRKSIKQGTLDPGMSCKDGVVAGAALARAFDFDMTDPKLTLKSSNADTATVQVLFKDGTKEVYTMTLQGRKWLIGAETVESPEVADR